MASQFHIQDNLFGEPIRRKFVVKRHATRVLHYQLRLVFNGEVFTWILLGKPTLDPDLTVKALSHPIKDLEDDSAFVVDKGNYWLLDLDGQPIESSLKKE